MIKNLLIVGLCLKIVSLIIAANVWQEGQMIFLFLAAICGISVPLVLAAAKQPGRAVLTIKFRGK